jgi:hypothetical protein
MLGLRTRGVYLIVLGLGCQTLGSVTGNVSGGGLGGLAGGLTGDCGGDLGATAAANRLENFIASVNAFSTSATELDTSLRTACTRMATDLGIPASELAATGGENPTQKACDRVARQLREDFTALRGTAGLQVALDVQPPRCEISVEAYGGCAAQCDASYTPGSADVQCEGGELRGTCSGQCTGRCSAEVSGSCSGACEGTCSGGCTGTCAGVCEGQCATRGADGSCNGRCQGTCRGTCSAGCTGSCSGRCEVSGGASCSGECRGGCSVAYTAPRCTGRIVPPRVSAECRASCDARLDAQATCTPARATLRITGNVSTDLQARATRLRTAIESGYGQILDVRAKVERVGRSGAALVSAVRELPSAVSDISVLAARCAATSATSAASAAASVQVSVSVSVNVSGSFSAGS